ncbi:MAG TPA: hypothetical protein PLY87_16610 [Planctomycetaceae bacterium]|nr:hypothetical protein [Planctomycetaceae bacterium]
MTSTALTTTAGGEMLPAYQKIIDPMAWCVEIGKAFQVTFNLTSPHHGTVMALTCLAENIPPTIYNQRYHGDGSMRASSIQARFLERGGKIEWLNIGDDGAAAIARFTHPNQPSGLEIVYTIGDAKTQVGDKIAKPGSNWATNPGAMLRAALIRKAIKIIDPGIIGGFDSFNEFADQQPLDQKPAAKKSRAERAEELKATETAAVVTGETVTEYTAEPETIIDAVTESPPFETTTTEVTTDDSEEPATPDLLQELVALGKKIPSQANPGKPMELREIADGVCKACKVEKPQQATRKQIRALIAKFRATLGEK